MNELVHNAMKLWHELMADGRYGEAWTLLNGDLLKSWHDHTSELEMVTHYIMS